MPKVVNISSVLRTPTHVKFAEFLFQRNWFWVILALLLSYFSIILVFAGLLAAGGADGMTGCTLRDMVRWHHFKSLYSIHRECVVCVTERQRDRETERQRDRDRDRQRQR